VDEPTPLQRARIAQAVAARETADFARGLVGDVATPMMPGERIRKARRLRLLALTVLDRTVLIERALGASWAEIADALARSEDAVRDTYEEVFERWAANLPPEGMDASIIGDFTIGLRPDMDPLGTAESLDLWYERTRDDWDSSDQHPVTRAVTT
jgi:hypothetical protein